MEKIDYSNRAKLYWKKFLDLKDSAFRKPTIKANYYSRRKLKHPYGICTVIMCKTFIAQELYGAIKEFIRDDTDRWLN